MALVVVMIETDHTDVDDAVRSVKNSMERAGYDFESCNVSYKRNLSLHGLEAIVNVCEPEVNPNAVKH